MNIINRDIGLEILKNKIWVLGTSCNNFSISPISSPVFNTEITSLFVYVRYAVKRPKGVIEMSFLPVDASYRGPDRFS